MRPLKLTVTEWTESRNWTESTETYGAKRSAQAQLSLGKADWQEPRGYCRTKRDAAGLAGSLSGRNSRNC